MPKVRIDSTLEMHYEVDDFTDPWTKPETFLLVHGIGRNSKVWYAWVPRLARRFRVIRPDLRGFGQSSPVTAGFQWSISGIARELKTLLDILNVDKVHYVGSMGAATFGLQFAHEYPDRLSSLTACTGPAKLVHADPTATPAAHHVDREGMRSWIEGQMDRRLGNEVPQGMKTWFTEHLSSAPLESVSTIEDYFGTLDLRPLLPQIKTPTLAIFAQHHLLPLEVALGQYMAIPNVRLLVLPSTGYDVSVAMADRCVDAVLEFVDGLKR
ncbi:MAG: alpha/beta hydrolase [Chloroflexi bacterium]|nr:alpha/beta hydrolase [Chloroflexota bacterium]